jgi:high-affinity iron transporter
LDLGSFSTGLLTGLREGVEAALIVSIILAYLARTGHLRELGRIWLGVGAAIFLSAAAGAILWITIGELRPPAEQLFEGSAMILAAAVVTWMLFWMRRSAANVRGELHAAVDRSLTEGRVWGLSLLAFTAVIREGLETALFLLGQASAASRSELGAASVLAGALLGLVAAAAMGVGFYRGARVINLRTFFTWTGVALVFVAGGILSRAVHEFIEAGFLGFGTGTAFDISAVLPHEGTGPMALVGGFLRAIFGYTSTPEWATLLVWLAYVVIVIVLYLRPIKPSATSLRREREVARA